MEITKQHHKLLRPKFSFAFQGMLNYAHSFPLNSEEKTATNKVVKLF